MKPTIKQIADLAHVSIGTVDRVIHNRGRVKQKTQERIEKIIQDLEYKPNVFARNLALRANYRIAVMMPHGEQDGGYWLLPLNGIEQAVSNLQHYNLNSQIFYYDKNSEISFRNTAKKFLKEDFDALLIAPIHETAAKWLFSKLPEKFPYVIFDNDISGTDALTSIHQNSYQGGLVAAELLDKMIGENSNVVIMQFMPRTSHTAERIIGFKKYLSKVKRIKFFEVDVPENCSNSKLNNLCNKRLSRIKKIDGIFVSGAHTYEIANYLEKNDGRRKIPLIGFDAIPANIDYLKKDVIDFLISQSPDLQGFTGIYSIYRNLAHRDKISKKISLPIEIITKGNLDYFLEARIVKKNRQKAIFI